MNLTARGQSSLERFVFSCLPSSCKALSPKTPFFPVSIKRRTTLDDRWKLSLLPPFKKVEFLSHQQHSDKVLYYFGGFERGCWVVGWGGVYFMGTLLMSFLKGLFGRCLTATRLLTLKKCGKIDLLKNTKQKTPPTQSGLVDSRSLLYIVQWILQE